MCVCAGVNMTELVHMCRSGPTVWPATVIDTLCQTPAADLGLSGSVTIVFVRLRMCSLCGTKGRERGKTAAQETIPSPVTHHDSIEP